MLSKITPLIRKLVDGKDLTAEEVKKIIVTTSREDSEGYYYLAFTASILTKGLTEDELFGLIKGLQEFTVKLDIKVDPREVTDLSGSGGDKLTTFNISTAASFVVAGGGVKVAKQAFKAFTSPIGASEILQEIGVEMPESPKKIEQCLQRVGIAPIYYPYMYKGMEARHKATTKMREIGLGLPTPMHPVAFVPHPLKIKRRTYGLFAEKYLLPVANIFRRLGYERVMVFHGLDGLDEVSTIGKTRIVELEKKIKEYMISPGDLGIKKARYEDIRSISKERNIIDFLRILYCRDMGARRDIVLANAAASFYVMDKVKNLADGVKLAGEVIDEGAAFKKLEALVDFLGDRKKLESWKRKANVSG